MNDMLTVYIVFICFQCITCFHSHLHHIRLSRRPIWKLRSEVANVMPVIDCVDSNNSVAKVKIYLSGEDTMKAFNESCASYMTQAFELSNSVNNNTLNASMSLDALHRIFGEEKIKLLSLQYLSGPIARECIRTGLPIVGGGRILNYKPDLFIPGQLW